MNSPGTIPMNTELPELRNSAEQRQNLHQLPLWYGGPQQAQRDRRAVLEDKDQGTTVVRVQPCIVQVDPVVY